MIIGTNRIPIEKKVLPNLNEKILLKKNQKKQIKYTFNSSKTVHQRVCNNI